MCIVVLKANMRTVCADVLTECAINALFLGAPHAIAHAQGLSMWLKIGKRTWRLSFANKVHVRTDTPNFNHFYQADGIDFMGNYLIIDSISTLFAKIAQGQYLGIHGQDSQKLEACFAMLHPQTL